MFNRKIIAFFNKKPRKINGYYIYKPRKILFWFFVFIITLLFIISIITFLDGWENFFINLPNICTKIKEFLNWNLNEWTKPSSGLWGDSFLKLSFNSIWNTILMVFSGTIIGVCFAIPISILSSNNIVNIKIINLFCKIILNILRTIPAFVYGLILFFLFGRSDLTPNIAIAIFTFSISSKMIFEKIENVNMDSYNLLLTTGTSKLKAFNTSILPQIKFEILSIIFYCLEINLKYVAVISVVTKVGIGYLIEQYSGEWNKVGFLLFVLITTILVIELIIIFLKKYVFFDKDYLLTDKENKLILKNANKRINKNNIKFYIDEVILNNWYKKYNQLKKQYKEKIIDKKYFKKEFKNLLLEKNKLIKEFKTLHNEKINEDHLNLINIKKQYPQQYKKWFIKDKENKLSRLDKIYLSKFNNDIAILKSNILNEARTKVEIKNKEFLNSLTINKVKKNKPYNFIKRIILFILIFIFFIISLTNMEFYLQNKEMIKILGTYIKRMFNINWASFFYETDNVIHPVIYLLYETLLIAVCGTIIGFIIALIFAILGSKNISNFYVSKIFTFISIIMRPIPKYIYVIFFVVIVGFGPVNGILTIAVGTIGMLSKYIRELFDNIDKNNINNIKSLGFNRFQVFRYCIFLQTSTELVSWFFYRLEINYKEIIGLGIIGAGNLGLDLFLYFNTSYFEEFGALLFGIILSSLFLEYISILLKQKLLKDKNNKLYERISKFIKSKKITKYQINAYFLNINYANITYEQLKLLWIDTNIEIKKNAKKIKSNNKKIKNTYFIAYCQKYNLNFDLPKKAALKFEKKFRIKDLEFIKKNYFKTI